MQLVVDANILFAALIKDSKTMEMLASHSGAFYAPEFILEEVYKHKDEILQKTRRSAEEFNSIMDCLEELIVIVPKEEYSSLLGKAEAIAPDPDDVPYLALAMRLNVPLWSNDRKLKEQKAVPVYSTKDLIS